jgi:porphobilinogen synthase
LSFPSVRMRRLRRTSAMRSILQTVRIHPSNLIYPIFVDETVQTHSPIKSMSNYYRVPITKVVDEVSEVVEQGIKAVILFGIPLKKNEIGSNAFAENGVVQQAIRKLKKEFSKELVVITDVCLCQYTTNGHCGIVKDGEIVNDLTLELLQKVAVSQAQAGVDVVAPSAMMDGQVRLIREALDDAGFNDTAIMPYSAKYASGFYGPFREAVDCAPKFRSRKSYQMCYGSQKEALREIELDVNEGADMIMIKPALPYLDIIQCAKSKFNLPIAAYQVSGEYAMIKAAAQQGCIDEKTVILEVLTAIKRAGSDLIITYFAKDVKSWLNEF